LTDTFALTLPDFRFWQILLQNSVVSNGCPSVIRLRMAGFDLPVLTLSIQLSSYAMH